MITLVEALNFRCFKYIRQPLGPFHVLVGPNGSGKSAFMDVLMFLRDYIRDGLDIAVKRRSDNFYDLVHGRDGDFFEIAIEFRFNQGEFHDIHEYRIIRYEIRFLLDQNKNEIVVDAENVFTKPNDDLSIMHSQPLTIITKDYANIHEYSCRSNDQKRILYKKAGESSGHINVMARKNYSILAQMISDQGNHIYDLVYFFLSDSIYGIDLDTKAMSMKAPPGSGLFLESDGSNLPWVVDELQKKNTRQFDYWVQHLKTYFPHLISLRTVLNPHDRSRYLMIQYEDGLEVPSWIISEGTLRLMALTLLPYISGRGIYLIEEPENGIHPQGVETIMQSLTSVYDGQVLLTTHSTFILSLAKPEQVLIFRQSKRGMEISEGNEHPYLKDRESAASLSTLFSAGVL